MKYILRPVIAVLHIICRDCIYFIFALLATILGTIWHAKPKNYFPEFFDGGIYLISEWDHSYFYMTRMDYIKGKKTKSFL